MRTILLCAFILASTAVAAPTGFEGPKDDPIKDGPLPDRPVATVGQRDTGWFGGVRAGYAFPFGNFTSKESADGSNDGVVYVLNGLFPLQLESGWTWGNGVSLGAYFEYAIGQIASGCPRGADCHGHDLRYGLQLNYRLGESQTGWMPWVGLAGGLEAATFGLNSNDATYSGWQAAFEAGADTRIGPHLRAGPLLSFSTGVYRHLDVNLGGATGSEDIRDQTAHAWLVLGARLTFSATR